MHLREALDDVYMFAARPKLVAAAGAVDRNIRWVHATEQIDIAPLLRGGELILMEGVNLVGCSDDELQDYVGTLVAADVAGLAVEPTEQLGTIPAPLIEHAERLGFPVVHLRHRVPFVQICESINSQLSDSTLRRLQIADRMSRVLSASIEELVAVDAILAALSRETRSEVTLRSMSGELIGRAGPVLSHDAGTAFDAPVAFGGTVVATLTLVPARDADIYLISAGIERAPEILAIALLSTRPPTTEERLRTRFFSLLTTADHPPSDLGTQLDGIAERLGLAADSAYLSLLVEYDDEVSTGTVQAAVEASSRMHIGQLVGKEYLAVLEFDRWSTLEIERAQLMSRLERVPSRARSVVVGPGARNRHGIRRCMAETRTTRSLHRGRSDGAVLDARDYAVARLLAGLPDEGALAVFVDDQIGELLRRDRERHGELFETLLAYVTNWGSKTETARALGIQRQTLYQRLDRLLAVLGPLPAGSARIPGVVTAVFLEHAARQRRGAPPSQRRRGTGRA